MNGILPALQEGGDISCADVEHPPGTWLGEKAGAEQRVGGLPTGIPQSANSGSPTSGDRLGTFMRCGPSRNVLLLSRSGPRGSAG